MGLAGWDAGHQTGSLGRSVRTEPIGSVLQFSLKFGQTQNRRENHSVPVLAEGTERNAHGAASIVRQRCAPVSQGRTCRRAVLVGSRIPTRGGE
jgi:hypothetical protein